MWGEQVLEAGLHSGRAPTSAALHRSKLAALSRAAAAVATLAVLSPAAAAAAGAAFPEPGPGPDHPAAAGCADRSNEPAGNLCAASDSVPPTSVLPSMGAVAGRRSTAAEQAAQRQGIASGNQGESPHAEFVAGDGTAAPGDIGGLASALLTTALNAAARSADCGAAVAALQQLQHLPVTIALLSQTGDLRFCSM